MHKKVLSLMITAVALAGFALAAFIPSASAQRSHVPTNTTYCEYTQYNECTTTTGTTTTPTTTTTGGTTTGNPTGSTTTATTSSTTTPLTTTTGTSTTPGGTPSFTLTASYQFIATINGASVSANGTVTFTILGSNLPAGLTLAPGCKITANSNGTITIDDNGTVFTVSYSDQLSVAFDGAALITQVNGSSTSQGLRVADRPVKALPKRAVQYVILPSGRTSNKFSYWLPSGVSFGKSVSWKSLAKHFTVNQVTNTKTLKTNRVPLRVTTAAVVASANKSRSAFTLKTNRPVAAYKVTFNMNGLHYSKSALKQQQLKSRFSIISAAAGKTSNDHLSFVY